MSKSKVYIARATRSNDWWAITIDELKGVHSQVRRLDQADEMAKEAIGLFLDMPPSAVSVRVEPVLPPKVQAGVEKALAVRGQVDELQREAAKATARAARELVRDAHLSVREAGKVLGISHQRIAQLLQG